MDISDGNFIENRDWDPVYQSELFAYDFYAFDELWNTDISDYEMIMEGERVEKYNPIVEDISLEDEELCCAVEKTEKELVLIVCNCVFFEDCEFQFLLS